LRQKESNNKALNGTIPLVKKDISMLKIMNSKEKYSTEKSSCYIGYKLLWIIKMNLEGRQFPYGSLLEEQWKTHVF
jgi:hypothetical protein